MVLPTSPVKMAPSAVSPSATGPIAPMSVFAAWNVGRPLMPE